MRKKSHISLAKHIVHISDMQEFNRHKKAFYVGSILPDCKPSFLTKRHEITETFDLMTSGIEKLVYGYDNADDLSTMYFTRLGEVVHYVADYFTFPHNKEYTGSIKEHCIYEGELKHKLRTYIKNITNKDIAIWENRMRLQELEKFQCIEDICKFIHIEHEYYISRKIHCIEEDCKYIVEICSWVAMAILNLCVSQFSETHHRVA